MVGAVCLKIQWNKPIFGGKATEQSDGRARSRVWDSDCSQQALSWLERWGVGRRPVFQRPMGLDNTSYGRCKPIVC